MGGFAPFLYRYYSHYLLVMVAELTLSALACLSTVRLFNRRLSQWRKEPSSNLAFKIGIPPRKAF